jgi:hypothetical protein
MCYYNVTTTLYTMYHIPATSIDRSGVNALYYVLNYVLDATLIQG